MMHLFNITKRGKIIAKQSSFLITNWSKKLIEKRDSFFNYILGQIYYVCLLQIGTGITYRVNYYESVTLLL